MTHAEAAVTLHCSCFSCGPDHANILSFGRGSSLCDMIACPVTEDQVCRVRLGWHQAPCQQVQALMSSVMDGLVTAAHIHITAHGQCRVILVRGCVTGPVSPVPPFLGVTQSSESPPGDFSRPRPRITMTRRGNQRMVMSQTSGTQCLTVSDWYGPWSLDDQMTQWCQGRQDGYAAMMCWHMRYTITHDLHLVMLITLQHTCSTLHYITVQVLLQAREEGKVLVSFTDSRRRRVHFWVASNKQ